MQLIGHVVLLIKLNSDLETDADVSEFLGLKRAAFSNYKHGLSRIPDRVLATMATAAGIPFAEMVAIANLTAKTTPAEEAEFWFEMLSPELQEVAMRKPVELITVSGKPASRLKQRVGAERATAASRHEGPDWRKR